MPWHLSKSDPRKVYDERHETVCVCQTEEQAARIVGAVNGWASGGEIRLREPARNDVLYSWEPDKCCGPKISKAATSGVLANLTVWTCPKCGCDWQPDQRGETSVHWSPSPPLAIFRPLR